MKRCKKCGLEKEFSRFDKHPRTLDGFKGSCKDCENAAWRARYASDSEFRNRKRLEGALWALRNPEKARAKRRRNYTTEKGRKWNHKHAYGLTPEQYAALLSSQGGICAVCKQQKRLVVDHDHKTGAVRGLLCYRCNTLVGVTENRNALSESIERYLTIRGGGCCSGVSRHPVSDQCSARPPQDSSISNVAVN
jgi:Autographiviridae endonuclease VII